MPETAIYVNDERFLGRENEQDYFRRVLRDLLYAPPEADAPPHLCLIHGEGGMGKSQLTRRFYDIATGEEPFADVVYTLRVDWEIWRDRKLALQIARDQIAPESLLDVLYQAASEAGWERHLGAYQKALKQRAQVEAQVAAALDKETPEGQYAGLRDLGAAGLAKLIRAGSQGLVGDVGEATLRAGLGDVIQGGAEGLHKARTQAERFLRERAKLKGELEALYRQPEERLARALGEGFARCANGAPLVLLFDTYEIVAAADRATRELIRAAGPRVFWIIAGRDNLAASRPAAGYVGYSAEFASRNLMVWDIQELNIDHYCAYLRERAPERETTREDAAALHQATLGVPLALRQAADLWAEGVPLGALTEGIPDYAPRAEIVRLMCERVLMHVERGAAGQEDRRALYLLAMQPRPDSHIQAAVLRPVEADAPFSLGEHLVRLARRYSAVRLESGARLHEAMEGFVREYLLKTEARADVLLPEIAGRAIAALRARRDALERDLPTLAERVESADWRQATLDLVHWLFWQEERAAWGEFIPRFVEGLGYDEDFAHALHDGVAGFVPALGKDGQQRHKRLHLSWDNRETLLDELERLAARDWLGDKDISATAERRAILYFRRGKWCADARRYADALRMYLKADGLLSPLPAALQELLAEAFEDVGEHFAWKRDGWKIVDSLPSPEAELALSKTIALGRESASLHHTLGAVQSKLGKHQDSLLHRQRAVEMDPQYQWAWHGLGNVYSDLGRHDEAIAAYYKAIALDATYATSWHGLGNVYGDLGRHDEAIAAYEKAIALDAAFAYAWNNLGTVYRALGRHDEAIAAYEKAIALDATDASSWHGLGLVYASQEQWEQAARAFQKALDLAPDEGSCHSSLAGALRHLGREDEAAAHLARARELIPADNHYNRACLEALAGNPELALEQLAQALAQSPGDRAWAARDPDFASLRDHPRFQALV